MPTKFWNDKNNIKIKNAYFNKFKGVWHHGDYAEIKNSGGYVIYGRSDATLNPGGVRLGTNQNSEDIVDSVIMPIPKFLPKKKSHNFLNHQIVEG